MAPGVAVLGELPLAKDDQGKLKSRIGTVFPRVRTIVTLPGIHATQRLAYIEQCNGERCGEGLPALTRAEEAAVLDLTVDLVMEDDAICIRPDPSNMDLAFEADDLLQELIPKHRIRFLLALDPQVREAIKRRGECWRIAPLPKSADEMKAMIANSRIGIGGRELYHHSRSSGTRYLTYENFASLQSLSDEELRQHLIEIRAFSAQSNALNNPEIDFFGGNGSFTRSDFASHDFSSLGSDELRAAYKDLKECFHEFLPVDLLRDDPDSVEWRNEMCIALLGQEDEVITEETLLGLSSEFFMQIQWLPGGRIDEGELILDPIFSLKQNDPEVTHLRDDKSRAFILNFVREYGDLEYVNIGRVIGSLSHRKTTRGRREVYIAELKQRDSDEEIVSIIRKQKWGVHEHLEDGMSLLDSVLRSEEYTEYVLDRRLGCRQLGMNLPKRVTAKRVPERYSGNRAEFQNTSIWYPYFERNYIRGIATDKIPPHRFNRDCYALKYAWLLGRAAAPNIVVGRCTLEGDVLFDDGDEVVIENENGLPSEIVVADQTGTFVEFRKPLDSFAIDYANPINRLVQHVSNPDAFARTYLDGFEERFRALQREYGRRQRAFDTLFQHRAFDEHGSFAYRWRCVLERLKETDAHELRKSIQANVSVEVENHVFHPGQIVRVHESHDTLESPQKDDARKSSEG